MAIMEKNQLIAEINRLKKEKNAVIMAHYYQMGDIQDIADNIGDSLALAQWAAKTDADMKRSKAEPWLLIERLLLEVAK